MSKKISQPKKPKKKVQISSDSDYTENSDHSDSDNCSAIDSSVDDIELQKIKSLQIVKRGFDTFLSSDYLDCDNDVNIKNPPPKKKIKTQKKLPNRQYIKPNIIQTTNGVNTKYIKPTVIGEKESPKKSKVVDEIMKEKSSDDEEDNRDTKLLPEPIFQDKYLKKEVFYAITSYQKIIVRDRRRASKKAVDDLKKMLSQYYNVSTASIEWNNMMPSSTVSEKISILFTGFTIHDKKVGFGRLYSQKEASDNKFFTKMVFEGFLKDDKKNGIGRDMHLSEVTSYYGNFKNGLKESYGEPVNSYSYHGDRKCYVAYRNDQKEGPGLEYFTNGKTKYRGNFNNDTYKPGFCVMYWANGQIKFIGELTKTLKYTNGNSLTKPGKITHLGNQPKTATKSKKEKAKINSVQLQKIN